jgi:DNA-binding CsgD family transcriptional regulator
LSDGRTSEPIVIALEIDEAGLADKIAALLAETPGIRLAEPGEAADAVLVSPNMQAVSRRALTEPDTSLTHRELEVLALLAEGASNKTVARRLGISVHTAKFHVGSLIDKLEASGRTDAVAHAARLGIINL